MGIPGTQMHHDWLVEHNNRALGTDEELANNAQKRNSEAATQAETEARIPLTQAQVPLTQAQTKEAEAKTKEAEAKASGNLTVKEQAEIDHLKAETQHLNNPSEKEPDVFTQWRRENPTKTVEDWLKLHPGTKSEYADFRDDYLKAHPKASMDAVDRAFAQVTQRAPTTNVFVPNPNGGYDVQIARGGSHVAPGAVTVAGMNSMNTPTTTMRNVGQVAQVIHQETPRVLENIQTNAAQLGPVLGRWSEFMQGKIGMDNPALADLRADLTMYSSAVALAHARGRLPENLRQEFDHMINASNQTPGNLIAVIKRVDQWMGDLGKTMRGNQGISDQHNTSSKMIPVIAPDGTTGEIPEDKWAEAEKRGYKKQ
jgi:hypothetical protein